MDDPRLRRIRTRPERPLLDWTRVKETGAHWWHLVHKPWPSAAIDTTLDWERAKLVWKTRNVDPHAWSPLRCAWAAMGAAHRIEPAAAVAGLAVGAGAALAWRSLRGRLFAAAAACAGGRYLLLVPALAASVYRDKSWHPALEDPSHVFTPWRREHRRGVDQSARLSLLPAHILSSALGPAALVLGLAYVATSPALRRAGLYHRMSRDLVADEQVDGSGLDAGPSLVRTASGGGKPEEAIVAVGEAGEQIRVVSVADEPELRPLASIHGHRANVVAVVANIEDAASMDSARMWMGAAESGMRGGTPLLLVLLRGAGVTNEAVSEAKTLADNARASTWLVSIPPGVRSASLARFSAEFKSRVAELLSRSSIAHAASATARPAAATAADSTGSSAPAPAKADDPWLASSNKARAFARSIPATAPAVRVAAFGGAEALVVDDDAPVPVPGPGECLIRVRAVGVNPVDTYIRSGAYARLPSLPYTPGADCSGELVLAVAPEPGTGSATLMVPGTDEHGLPRWAEPGAAVFTGAARTGSYATYAVAPFARVVPFRLRTEAADADRAAAAAAAAAGEVAAGEAAAAGEVAAAAAAAAGEAAAGEAAVAEAAARPQAAGMTWAQAAAVPTPYYTAYRALNSTRRFAPGCAVLVHGASGAVGIAAVQLATRKGAFVVGTASSEAGRAAVVAAGANAAVGHGDVVALRAALAATAGRSGSAPAKTGFDVVVECLANANLGTDLTLLAQRGHVAVVGSRGTAEVNPRDLMAREASVAGVALAFASDAELAAMTADIGAWLRWTSPAGGVKPLVGRSFDGLAGAAQAHRDVMEHPGGAVGKLVLKLAAGAKPADDV